MRADPAPADLRDALARALRDPSLTLAYWLPEYGSWADVHGREVELPGHENGLATTLIDRDGERMAALVHDASLQDEPELLEAVRAAAGISLENARLHAELAARLEELRDIARGLHPAVVSGHGLAVALESLAARAPLPVALNVELEDRLPEALEVAAYYLVSESIANIGKHAQANAASVDVTRNDGHVVVEIVDDGIGGADTERGSGLRGLADRVEALDGRLRVWTPIGEGTRVRAEIPCA